MQPQVTRRDFLIQTALVTAAASAGLGQAAPPRAPYRVLYSNDLTNVVSCISPWHKPKQAFSNRLIEASIEEVAGKVDVHLFQPGLGWIPWWKSKIYPAEEHYRWFMERTGTTKLDSFGKYMLDGGDVMKPFLAACRKTGQAAFVSLRMNDAHHLENFNEKNLTAVSASRFYVDHPEYRLGPDPKRPEQHVLNWAFPEVRAHKLAFVRELCENYDIDGFEMDFMRFFALFQVDKTPLEQRREIMTGFFRQVREILDRTSPPGRRRWLCARVPCLLPGLDALGLDLAQLAKAGLDMVNVSASYFTTQNTDFAAIRRLTAQPAMYLELCHTTWNGPKLSTGYDSFPFRRATPEQLETTAHLAYARGADGISLFNYVYYREHGGPGRGAFSEPPFEVLKGLGDRAYLAKRPQHFFLSQGWNNPFVRPSPLPHKVAAKHNLKFDLDLAPPAGGWQKDGRLRLQMDKNFPDSAWTAKLNGTPLKPTPDVTEPFPTTSTTMLGTPEEHRAWQVPAALVKDGPNHLELTYTQGQPTYLVFIDLAFT